MAAQDEDGRVALFYDVTEDDSRVTIHHFNSHIAHLEVEQRGKN